MRRNIVFVLFLGLVTISFGNYSFADKGAKGEGVAGKDKTVKAEGGAGKNKGTKEEAAASKDSAGRLQRKVEDRVNDLTAKLSLTTEQQNGVKEILMKSGEERNAVLAETKVKLREVRHKARTQIETLLTGDQKEKFKGLCKESDAQKQEEEVDNDE